MRTWTAMALAAIAGCSWGAPTAPAVVEVAPGAVTAGEATVLTITATGLDALQGPVDFDDPSQAASCEGFRVELREPGGAVVPLEGVVRVGATVLRGRVPVSAKFTTYDVWLIEPSGAEAGLAGAFVVDKCLPPGGDCRDGNRCTQGDSCTGAARCSAGTPLPDGAACELDCASAGAPVPGACAAGVCVPAEGACPAVPAFCAGE